MLSYIDRLIVAVYLGTLIRIRAARHRRQRDFPILIPILLVLSKSRDPRARPSGPAQRNTQRTGPSFDGGKGAVQVLRDLEIGSARNSQFSQSLIVLNRPSIVRWNCHVSPLVAKGIYNEWKSVGGLGSMIIGLMQRGRRISLRSHRH